MTNTPNFSKSKYCGLWQCPKIAWLRKYKPEEQKIGDDVLERMAEHIYMYSSENTQVKFRVVKPMISDVIDIFGRDVTFSDETDTHVTVIAHVNEMAMAQFAKSYAPDVMVLEPERLREEIKEEIEKSAEAYRG